MERIAYREGYEYQLAEPYTTRVSIYPQALILDEFIRMQPDGLLTILSGYAWDGASGPTIDSKNTMRGSVVHDALFQLMREGFLDVKWRKQADKELYRILREDGMSAIRAGYWYAGVRIGGGPSASINDNNILYAPE